MSTVMKAFRVRYKHVNGNRYDELFAAPTMHHLTAYLNTPFAKCAEIISVIPASSACYPDEITVVKS